MSDTDALLAELPRWGFGFALALARIGACVMLLPGLGEMGMPQTVRAGLGLALVLLLLPMLMPAMPAEPAHLAGLAAMLLTELLSGLTLGWLARLVVLALPMAGHVVSHMLGLSNVLQPDPELGGQSSALERLFGVAATALVMISGLYALPLMALAGSYRLIAPGGKEFGAGFAADGPGAIVGALSGAFALSLQLATPFVMMGIVWQIALGLLGRLVPRLQVYFVAMPGQILGGLLLLGVLTSVMLAAWQEHLREGWSRLPGLG